MSERLLARLCAYQQHKGERVDGGAYPVPFHRLRTWAEFDIDVLTALVDAGLVRDWGSGRNRHYQATAAGMAMAKGGV